MGLIWTPFSSKARRRVWQKSDEKLSSFFNHQVRGNVRARPLFIRVFPHTRPQSVSTYLPYIFQNLSRKKPTTTTSFPHKGFLPLLPPLLVYERRNISLKEALMPFQRSFALWIIKIYEFRTDPAKWRYSIPTPSPRPTISTPPSPSKPTTVRNTPWPQFTWSQYYM